MNALSNAMDAVPPVSPLWYWRVGLGFFIWWIWQEPRPIMIQLCFPINIADAMVHITYSAFSLHHYHNDYHEHHQLHLFVMLACYNWFLFKLFETPRDWDQGWNISNEPKKSCVVGQENNMPPIDYSIWGFFVTYPFLKDLSISGNKLPYTGIGFDLPVLALFSFFWRNPSGQSVHRSHDVGDLMQAGEGGPDL